jgi:hypothetical protein
VPVLELAMQSDTKEENSLCLFDPESRSVLFALDGHGKEIVRGGGNLFPVMKLYLDCTLHALAVTACWGKVLALKIPRN